MRGHALAIRPIAMTGAGLRLLASGHWAVLASDSDGRVFRERCCISAAHEMPDVSGFGDYEEAVQHPRRLQNPCNVSVQMDLGMRGTVLDLGRVVARLRRGAFAV